MTKNGIRHDKHYKINCGTCKRQGKERVCKKHFVIAPDKQIACNDYKKR